MTEEKRTAVRELAEKLRKLEENVAPAPWYGDRIDGTVKYEILGGFGIEKEVVVRGDNSNEENGPYGFLGSADEDLTMQLRNALPLILEALDALADDGYPAGAITADPDLAGRRPR